MLFPPSFPLAPQVMAMEAEAESTALLVGNDKLEDKFALLESGTGVNICVGLCGEGGRKGPAGGRGLRTREKERQHTVAHVRMHCC